MDALTHAMLSDEVTATIARAAEDPLAGDGANGSFVATRRVAARFRAVSTPRNHTVFAAAGAAAIAPTPLPRDAALLAASIRLTSAGGVADGVLDVSNATRADGGVSAGETVRGLGPDGSCRVVAKAVDETGSVVSVPSPNTFFTPAWARLIVNGALVPRSNETEFFERSALTLRDGDVVSVAVVAGARARRRANASGAVRRDGPRVSVRRRHERPRLRGRRGGERRDGGRNRRNRVRVRRARRRRARDGGDGDRGADAAVPRRPRRRRRSRRRRRRWRRRRVGRASPRATKRERGAEKARNGSYSIANARCLASTTTEPTPSPTCAARRGRCARTEPTRPRTWGSRSILK